MNFDTITIKFIPHDKQRQDCCGDYYKQGNGLHIRISDTGNAMYNMLKLLHELVELILVLKNCATFKAAYNWDVKVEKDISDWKREHVHKTDASSGGTYHSEHRFAVWLENAVCNVMGINWELYNETLFNLRWKKNRNTHMQQIRTGAPKIR